MSEKFAGATILEESIARYAKIEQDKNESVESLDDRIRDLETETQKLQDERTELVAPFLQEQAAIIAEVAPLVLQVGKFATGLGTLYKQEGRRKYDTDALDALKVSRPDIWKVISNYREQSEPEVRIRLKVNQKAE